ncbi:MAG TPA: tetratricopeptide repeat protein [Candidatus Acidoferrum sp.]|nr:tetratricopeptide repeat protein [Candidatus Acidoferrum sp.]
MKTLGLTTLLCLLLLGGAVNASAQGTATLDRAAAAAAAGRTNEAIQMYRALLEQDPQNAAALSSLSDLLEADGKWREAMPLLERLVKLEPQNSTALYRLGRMKSWQPGGHDEALELLRRACKTSKGDVEICGAYAEILSWGQETRAEAVTNLEAIVSANPDASSVRIRLARILSWNDATRARALALFDNGLQRDPKNIELLLVSAEVLSWRSASRGEALARCERVLKLDPDNLRALNGKAQLIAWQNRTGEALELYRRVLAKDPNNSAALRGEAEILNWKGRFVEARTLAQQAHTGAPSDTRASLELARANIGLQRFAQARQAIADVSGNPTPDFADVRQQIQRGLGTYVEFGYAFRQEPANNLEFHRFSAAVSTTLGPSNRVTFLYQPTLFDNHLQGTNSNYFGASLDSTLSDRVTTHEQAGAEVFRNVPVNVDGGVGLSFRPISSTTLKFNFQRQPVEESLLSTNGQNFGGVFFGQVYSNLGDVGISYNNAAHKYDFSLDYTDGVYTGRNLASNRRFSVDSQLGKSLRGDQPYVRVAYYVNYSSFNHDADVQPGQPLSRSTGGYFSPTRYLLNEGILTVGHRFSKTVQWGMSGAAGVQNVENNGSSFSNAQFASSFETHLFWRATPMNELTFSYAYLNVFNAFQRNLFRFAWRHYF